MQVTDWQQVLATGIEVPADRPLQDLTSDLTVMLGSPDPDIRDATAYPVLATWIERGVFDDLLGGLGDGMLAGLGVGIGESGTDTVFRRSFSVLVLAECLMRDHTAGLLPQRKLLEWADGIAAWYLRERDLRAFVPGKGWAHAIAHGADAIGVLGRRDAFGEPELTVLLEVLADRMLIPGAPWAAGEPDRLAMAAMEILRRDEVPLPELETWLGRIVDQASSPPDDEDADPFLVTGNAEAFLRALYLQLSLAPEPPPVRSDLLLALIEGLRTSNPHYLAART